MSDSTEIARMISPAQMKSIESFDDALALLEETHGKGALESAAEALGDGFALTENKDQFCGVPMLFVHWDIKPGDFPNPDGSIPNFVIARVVTRGGKFIITDGGHGIGRQLEEYTAETGKTFLKAEKGLTVSTYSNEYTKEGRTYYIDTTRTDA